MTLLQITLPLFDNDGRPLARDLFTRTLTELTDTFGGATAFTRAPAEGFWEQPDGAVKKDDVIVIEVQSETLDEAWWAAYKATLETRFRQKTVLIRAIAMRLI